MANDKVGADLIPDDLKDDYAMTTNPDEGWGPTFVRELIERIARLEAEVHTRTRIEGIATPDETVMPNAWDIARAQAARISEQNKQIALLEAKRTLHLTCPFSDSEKFSFHTQSQVDGLQRHLEAHAIQAAKELENARWETGRWRSEHLAACEKITNLESMQTQWANEIAALKMELESAKKLIPKETK